MNLMLIERHELRADATVAVSDARARHLREVLKVRPGATIRVGIVDGPSGVGLVGAVSDSAVELACSFKDVAAAPPSVDLLLALPRPKVLRRLFAQIAAQGVRRLVLTNAERVERHYFDTHVLSPDCYRPLLIEGLQQARDTRLPKVSVHRQFRPLVEDMLDEISGDAVRFVAHPQADVPLRDALSGQTSSRLLIAVGPEGGWNDFELRLLESHRFSPVSMGARTLRTDTACIALLALAHDALGNRSMATASLATQCVS